MAKGCYNADEAYFPASYRGISFECETAESEHGRRGAEGEFPFSENTAFADLGRKIRTYGLRARFAQNNHTVLARALAAVCEAPGIGILVHPVQGVISAVCRSCRVSDAPLKEAGVTYVDLDFVDASSFVSGFGFAGSLVSLSISTFLGSAVASFQRRYVPSNVRWYDARNVVATMGEAVDQLQETYLRASANDSGQTKWQTVRDFRTVTQDEFALNDADVAATVVQNAFSFIDGASEGDEKAALMRSVINWATNHSDYSGEAGEAQNAVFTFIRLLGATYLASAFTETQPVTVDEGLRQYDMVMTVLEQEAAIANADCYDTELFLAIREFSVLVSRVLLNRAYESPTLVTYSFAGVTHGLVAAYEIFGDAKRSRSLERRNPGAPWAVGPRIIAESVVR